VVLIILILYSMPCFGDNGVCKSLDEVLENALTQEERRQKAIDDIVAAAEGYKPPTAAEVDQQSKIDRIVRAAEGSPSAQRAKASGGAASVNMPTSSATVSSRGTRLGPTTLRSRGYILRVDSPGNLPPRAHTSTNRAPIAGTDVHQSLQTAKTQRAKQDILNEAFSSQRAKRLSQSATATSDGEPLTFFRKISQEELDELLKTGKARAGAYSKPRVQNLKDPIEREYFIDFQMDSRGLTRAEAEALVPLTEAQRVQHLIETKGWDWIMNQHKRNTQFSPLKGTSLGPHFPPTFSDDYVLVIRDTHGRAFRNPHNTFEDEWFFLNDIQTDEVMEVLTKEEYTRRFGHGGELYQEMSDLRQGK
jgi:hypothetical protein